MVPVGLTPQTTVVKPKAPELKALKREVALLRLLENQPPGVPK